MAISLRQHHESTTSSAFGADTTTLASSTTASDHVILFIVNDSSRVVASVSGLGATWTKLQSATPSRYYEVWSGVNCAAGQTVITVTWPGNTDAWYLSTVWGGAGQVVSSAITTGNTNNPATATVTPASSTQMVAGGFGQAGAHSWSMAVDGTDTPSAWTTVLDDTQLTSSPFTDTLESAYVTGITTAAQRSIFSDSAAIWCGYGVVLDFAAPPAAGRKANHLVPLRQAVMRAAVR